MGSSVRWRDWRLGLGLAEGGGAAHVAAQLTALRAVSAGLASPRRAPPRAPNLPSGSIVPGHPKTVPCHPPSRAARPRPSRSFRAGGQYSRVCGMPSTFQQGAPPRVERRVLRGPDMRLNLRRLGLLAGKAARMFAARAKLTPQRIDLLLLVRRGRYSQTDLAHRLCVTPCVVSRMLKALVMLDLVAQETSPTMAGCASRG